MLCANWVRKRALSMAGFFALDSSSLKLRAVYTTGEFAFVSCSCGVFVHGLWLKTEMLAGRGPWYLLVRGDPGEKMAAAPRQGSGMEDPNPGTPRPWDPELQGFPKSR